MDPLLTFLLIGFVVVWGAVFLWVVRNRPPKIRTLVCPRCEVQLSYNPKGDAYTSLVPLKKE